MANDLTLRRIGAELLTAIDENGNIVGPAALAIVYQKAYSIWKSQNLFAPRTLLTESGQLNGAASALYYIPSIPKTEDYDPLDWDWSKIQELKYEERQLNLDATFKIQRWQNKADWARLRQRIQEGNYEYMTNFLGMLISNMQVAAEVKRNSLIVENLVDLAKTNGIRTIHIASARDRLLQPYEARRMVFDPIWKVYSQFKKTINFIKGIAGMDDNIQLATDWYTLELLRRAAMVEGSDSAYGDFKSGELTKILGIKIVPLDQMDNLYSISEQSVTQDGKTHRKAIHVDTRGVNLILYHKDAFAYKFSAPFFEVDKIPATLLNTFTHIEYYPKKRLDILSRFCVGFKVEYEDKDDDDDNGKPDENPEEGKPDQWEQYTYDNVEAVWNGEYLTTDKTGDAKYWKAGEGWANDKDALKPLKNWYDFTKKYDKSRGKNIHFTKLTLWVFVDVMKYRYCVPIITETNPHLKDDEPLIKLTD